MKDAYYFPHDSNARHDPRIVTLCSKFGLVAYACFFQAIEMLRDQKGYCLDENLMSALSVPWQSYGDAINIQTASAILDEIFKLGLLSRENGKVFSKSLTERMSYFDEIRRKRSEAGSKGAAKLWQSHGVAMASKVNKSKVKEIKETTYTPNNGVGVVIASLPKPETELQKLVKGWKIMMGVPTEGDDSKVWDRNHFKRHAASAKRLLDEFGFEHAVGCLEYLVNYFRSKKLDFTLETIVNRSDLYREQLARRGI